MSIQHRDIPDSERHEAKGASSAIAGAVLVANGSGGTSFQKLGVASMTGSIPPSIADLLISTDGSGGFKTAVSVYGAFASVIRDGQPSGGTLLAINQDFIPQGIIITPGSNGSLTHDYFRVANSGIYLAGVINPSYDPDLAPPATEVPITRTKLVLNTNPTDVRLDSTVGLIYLDASQQYRLNGIGKFFVWKVAA